MCRMGLWGQGGPVLLPNGSLIAAGEPDGIEAEEDVQNFAETVRTCT